MSTILNIETSGRPQLHQVSILSFLPLPLHAPQKEQVPRHVSCLPCSQDRTPEHLLVSGQQNRFYLRFLYLKLSTYSIVCTNEAILLGLESRTSSPVRLPRDKETLEHVAIPGLYPAGEGAGYAGGIVSAAIDGIRCG